jgi:hypothetical protein
LEFWTDSSGGAFFLECFFLVAELAELLGLPLTIMLLKETDICRVV